MIEKNRGMQSTRCVRRRENLSQGKRKREREREKRAEMELTVSDEISAADSRTRESVSGKEAFLKEVLS